MVARVIHRSWFSLTSHRRRTSIQPECLAVHHGWMSQSLIHASETPFVLSRDCPTSTERAELSRQLQRGELVRVARGAYVPAAYWSRLSDDARYLAHIELVATTTDDDLLFSHASAAALWHLPWITAWPNRVHATSGPRDGGASTSQLVRHSRELPAASASIDGLKVTTLARTVADVAATSHFRQGVVVADAALRLAARPRKGYPSGLLTPGDLVDEAAQLAYNHGRVRMLRVAEFADGKADRPGESLSRVTMHLARITPPELQVELRGASGRRYFVDFWWPRFKVFGEFDGKAKYEDPEFLRGRTPQQALLDEKYREDDLRAMNRSCARWDWTVAQSVPLLRARLRAAGVR